MPSAAVRSTALRATPPVAVRFPGVIAAPDGVKYCRTGPSDENTSLTLELVNSPGYGPVGLDPFSAAAAGVAATDTASTLALWPRTEPPVPYASRPRLV